jgi:hypothetical protein
MKPGETMSLGSSNVFADTECVCIIESYSCPLEYFLEVILGCPLHCPIDPRALAAQPASPEEAE